jgi:peptide subunit release factor 1 (eRF1)
MKISLLVPKGTNLDDERSFIKKEIAQSRNIKDKTTRKAVIAGLGKIMNSLRDGYAIYSDGTEIFVEPYDGI